MKAIPSRQRTERALRHVARLRTLFRRLPYLPSPRESRAVADFDAFVAGTRDHCSRNALEAGVRAAFRRGDAAAILRSAERSSALREDPTLQYYDWAAQAGNSERSTVAAHRAESPRE